MAVAMRMAALGRLSGPRGSQRDLRPNSASTARHHESSRAVRVLRHHFNSLLPGA
jgi:hypothetical protein